MKLRVVLILTLYFFSCVPGLVLANSMSEADKQSLPLGIWHWHETGPENKLSVTISRENNVWTANVDGTSVAIEKNQNSIRFSLSNDQYFEGELLPDGNIEGNWVQSPPDHGFYSTMATMVSFASSVENQWQAVVHLQPTPFHLFLDIFEDDAGKLKAALRNPERNDIFRVTLFDVVHVRGRGKKQRWKMVAKRGSRKVDIPVIFEKDRSISLKHYMLPDTVVFSPASESDLNKYYSRRPENASWVHKGVRQLDDGWDVANAVDVGFDGEILDALVTKIATFDPRSRAPQMVHSLLVSHKGKLVMEEYFYGHTASDVHDTRSLAKVFGSIMIGAAQQKGYDITPEYAPLPHVLKSNGNSVSDQKSAIKLKHFMTYTSGLDVSDNGNSQGSENNLWNQQKEDFWLYTAKLPVLHPPGKRYAYASASANMVGAALEQTTGQPTRKFFHEAIAKPLQFSPYHWNLTPHNVSYLGGGVYMRPRDILKLGALYAANGRWKGKQIIPESWVKQSTEAKVAINPQTTGLSEEEFFNNYFGGHQAYIWRVDSIETEHKTFHSYEATGNGGQIIVIVPELELAVGFTGGNYRMGYVWGKWRQQIVGDYIIPALLK